MSGRGRTRMVLYKNGVGDDDGYDWQQWGLDPGFNSADERKVVLSRVNERVACFCD